MFKLESRIILIHSDLRFARMDWNDLSDFILWFIQNIRMWLSLLKI